MPDLTAPARPALSCIALALLTCGCSTTASDDAGHAPATTESSGGETVGSTGSFSAVEVHAHRGDRANVPPGNTMPAFEAAVALGVDALEGDMQITADGVVVMGHDDDLRQTGCTSSGAAGSRISAMTAADVAAWDCHPELGGVQPPARLDALLQIDPAVGFNLELKQLAEDDADVYLAALVVANAECEGCLDGRITLQSFAWATLQYARETYHARNSASGLEFAVSLLALGAGGPSLADAATFADVVSPERDSVSAATVAEAHALSLRVIPWTVNDVEQMQVMIAWGVDGLITDDPAAALTLLGR